MQDEALLQSLKAGSREPPFSKGCVPRIGHGLMLLQYDLTACVKSRMFALLTKISDGLP